MISEKTFFIYLAIMALTTYAIRVLPLVLCRGKIKNVFLKSFLTYIPYAVLGAMTFPAIIYSTQGVFSALVGTAAAVLLAYQGKSLLTVATAACIAVYVAEWILRVI